MSFPRPVLVIAGPTAVGKTEIAVALSESKGLPVISADSRQVYRHMDIGTAKPGPDDLARAPHELIDIRNPDEEFNVSDFLEETARVGALLPAGVPMIVAGGTGLYIRALLQGFADLPGPDREFRAALAGTGAEELHRRLEGLDPAAAARIHPRNRNRLVRALEIIDSTGRTMSSILEEQQREDQRDKGKRFEYFVLERPRHDLDQRISVRVDAMMKAGFVDEVRQLVAMGFGSGLSSMTSIGYREILDFLSGTTGIDETVESVKTATRRFSRRQMTWFRSEKSTRSIDLCQKGIGATLSEIYGVWERLRR